MRTFSRIRLAWAVLMAGLMTAMGDNSLPDLPAAFEVDLLIPHNTSYAPSPLMPIVFGVQNPIFSKSLQAVIKWNLWEGNNQRSPGSIGGGHLDVGTDVFSEPQPSNDLLLVSASVNTIAYPEGVWTLAWNLEYTNCSLDTTHSETFYTVFTVSKSGQAPDLEAATSADVCGTAQSLAYNFTSWSEIGCGMPGPSPTTNPCASTIDSAAAASLSAFARNTGYVCSWNSNLTCPTSFPSSSSPRVAAAFTSLTLLAALTALIHLG
ncbi:hypothetical protein MKX07_007629 [Trichoderma sp. CBMAI-0711]|uniref:DUF7136 domain-containing protein n=1 Tax=Trichoderma parareesei TaxID=858221 RepID=A0A2H2ZGX9_TRIPA|nr:hypothetical protein MKX07_007629 [Trichoderma sp. CBMAI-0711]OTA05028.1 hypothetical protein A9Z42_0056510 [Trichoderma parareesei]